MSRKICLDLELVLILKHLKEKENLILAEYTCQKIRNLVKSEELADYPQKFSPLCKFRTGQCDYYEICRG